MEQKKVKEKKGNNMNCLNCDSTNFENKKIRLDTAFAGETFEVVVPAFVCKKCKESLMDSKQMNVLRQTVADVYKEKVNGKKK